MALQPVNPIAPRALLPEDPAVAMALATELLGPDRVMANHAFGLWGYTGTAADGAPLTVQSTGIGGTSAAVVLAGLAVHGVRRAVVVDPAGDDAPATVVELSGTDGASRAVGHEPVLDPALTERLLTATDGRGVSVTSVDLPPGDLRTAALAAVAVRDGVRLGALRGPAALAVRALG